MSPLPYNKPDLHAPRNREKIADFLAYPSNDPFGFFSRMKQQYPQLSKYSNREIAKWIELYNQALAEQVVNERKGVKLPEKLGVVLTGLCKLSDKTAANNIDFNTSNRMGVKVSYRNDHTDGYTAKIYYTTEVWGSRYEGHKQWKFKPCRILCRSVAAVMKNEGYKKYLFFSQSSPVKNLFYKRKLNKNDKQRPNEVTAEEAYWEDYDEFSFD